MDASKKFDLSRLRFFVRELMAPNPDIKLELRTQHFLPNFCEGKMIINLVMIAEMLALVISLVMPVPSIFFSNYFEALFQISIFVQWIALACAAGLCLSRTYLTRLPNHMALITAYLILLLITFLVNECAVWVLWWTGKIASPRPAWYAHLHFQNLSISAIINALMLGYFLTKQELKQRTISEAQAKMQALQSRIRPHFVFNAMNIIASLTRSDPKKAETAIEDMSELFRMMLNEEETLVPVNKEIDVARKYLALEELRLDSRLQVTWDIGKFPRKAIMPILTLQPLLENAITHGVEPLPSGGAVSVTLWEEEDIIKIRITHPAPKQKKKDIGPDIDSALENIKQRFHTYYGDRAKIRWERQDNRFIISVSLPVRDIM
ncbi:MAG: histidine kinase [Gammaproteobacteria bacterium]|nr:histidine kinase [Gammaproteobacteria bacterium]